MNKLAPCPFCGSKAELDCSTYQPNNVPTYCVACSKCPASIGECNHYGAEDWIIHDFTSEQEAIEAWNKRIT